MAKIVLGPTTLLLFLLANSCLPLPEDKTSDRSFLRGLINLRKQIIPYTSAVEKRLNNELPIAPNSPYLHTEYLTSLQPETQDHDEGSTSQRNSRGARIEDPNSQRTKVKGRRIRYHANENSLSQQSKSERFVDDSATSNSYPPPVLQYNNSNESEELLSSPNTSLMYSSSYSNIVFPAYATKNSNTQASTDSVQTEEHLFRDASSGQESMVLFPSDGTIGPNNSSTGQYLVTSTSFNTIPTASTGTSDNSHNSQITQQQVYSNHNPDSYITTLPHRIRLSPNIRKRMTTERPSRETTTESGGLFESFMARLRRLPVLGNVLRATVDPIYRPLINSILPVMAENSKYWRL